MPEEKVAAKKPNTGLIAGIIGGAVAVIIIVIVSGGKANLVGKWNFYSMKQGDTEINAEDLKKMSGSDVDLGSIEFKNDGTGVMISGSTKTEFKYEGNKVTVDGESVEVKVDGDMLTMEKDGTSMVYKKN